jgi:asparagine synthase (glutamine-hydrolysing)
MFKSYVSNNLLTKISYATNRYNISAKAPYLNKKFIEFLATVDVSVKHKNKKNKYILRKILQKYIPLDLIDRPKRGFSTPAGDILKDEHRALLDNYINRDRLTKEGIFKPEEIMKLKDSFLNSRSVYDEQNIWNILIFELWYEYWFSE